MQKKCRRIAANEVFVDDNKLNLCIVEIDSAIVTNYYQFNEEQPNTEWVGGIITLKRDEAGQLKAYKNENLIE